MFLAGAVYGDVLGSYYEWNNIRKVVKVQKMMDKNCRFTDDTVMTCAVARGIKEALAEVPENWLGDAEAESKIREKITEKMVEYGKRYPRAGYGSSFRNWIHDDNRQPYNSWGNGSAMRVSYAGHAAKTLEEALALAKLSAEVTHNHPEGIKGAQVVAGAIFLLKTGSSKDEIREFVKQYYDMDFTLNEVRGWYYFDVSCQGSVPQAVEAFLEGESFEEVISLAISIGGDSDTIAAIAASMAEMIYPIPEFLTEYVWDRLTDELRDTLAFLKE